MFPKSLADPNGIWAMAGKLLSCVERSSTELVLNKTVHTDLYSFALCLSALRRCEGTAAQGQNCPKGTLTHHGKLSALALLILRRSR